MSARKARQAPGDEPAHVAAAFERDPMRAARETLIREATRQARVGFEGQPALRAAREAMAATAVAECAGDGDTFDYVVDEALLLKGVAAGRPAVSWQGVAGKLALLCLDLVDGAEDPAGVAHLRLAAGALADVVILQDRPLHLPQDVAEPVLDAEDVDRRRARGAAMMSVRGLEAGPLR